jgi:DNA-binding PadR family transcriptional regulator
MSKAQRSNPLALAVLVTLYERPMHPYEVAHTLRARAKHESMRLNYGSLYSVVEALEKRELIRAREPEQEGKRPPRTVYEITPAGTRELADWLAELIATPTKEYLRFEAGLSFMAALPPDEVVVLLHQRHDALEDRLTALRAGLAATDVIPRLFMVESEYLERLCVAELHFVEELTEAIESGELDGIELWRSFSPEGLTGAVPPTDEPQMTATAAPERVAPKTAKQTPPKKRGTTP